MSTGGFGTSPFGVAPYGGGSALETYPPAPGGGALTYYMRARRISAPAIVTWITLGEPDHDGGASPYPGDVADIVVAGVSVA